MDNMHLLSIIAFLPLVGAIFISFLPKEKKSLIRNIAFLFSAATFALSTLLYFFFDSTTASLQFREFIPWISGLGANYSVGIDGISLFLVMLTTFLSSLAVLSAFGAIETRIKEFMIFMLFLNTTMIGVFISLDLLLFYVFWEAMLIPMYFLIGMWGGPRRIYASMKFFLYTLLGGALMLVAILYLHFGYHRALGEATFDLYKLLKYSSVYLPIKTQFFLFLAFAIAFAIKVPLFPFHTWLPDAHVEAPTPGSVILAGILLKMGAYGFLRFAIPLFPAVSHRFFFPMGIIAVIGIIYGALVACAQKDIKRLVAYSSISHLGFIILGIFSFTTVGMMGGILQMVNHGLSTGALFLLVGMLYERTHKRGIDDFGGLASQMPIFSAFLLIVTLSSIGLPGLNGFVGEFLILLGAFKVSIVLTAVAAIGIILGAVYMLGMFQKVAQGVPKEDKRLVDLSFREISILSVIVLLMFWIGLYPKPILSRMEASVKNLVKDTETSDYNIQMFKRVQGVYQTEDFTVVKPLAPPGSFR